MLRLVKAGLAIGLAAFLSGVGELVAENDCAADCMTESDRDPCRGGTPCTTCSMCPCAHRAPAVPAAEVSAPAVVLMAQVIEVRAQPPAAPALARPFQPPRA